MVFFKFYHKTKSDVNKLNNHHKKSISFKAYELLKRLVVTGKTNVASLDNAYPKNTKLKVLKNVSQRSMKTFYKLSDKYDRDKNGVLSQINEDVSYTKKKISPYSKQLLDKINKDQPRYQKVDELIERYSK
tara:strand:- start:118 stop:510 length:393 start_codon:yes stop_codon:yes gene_type:complete